MTVKTVLVEGVPIAFHDVGQGPPVLLLHGFPLTSESFRPQMEALAARYRIIAPDHRGFGHSGGGGGASSGSGAAPLEMSRIARDALAVLDALGVRRAVVGGVSMGGYAAMALLREDAGRVAGLVLMDTQAGADDEAGKARREDTARAVLEKGVGVLVESMLPRLVAEDAAPSAKAEVERLIRSNRPEGCAAALRGMALRTDSMDVLARFAGPALVVVGEKDAITPRAKSEEMVKAMSGARLVEVPRAGHLSNLETPGPVNAALDAFLGQSVENSTSGGRAR